MRETQLQIKLPGVPQAKQGRAVPPQWEWTEAAVWTERMLATLEGGIKESVRKRPSEMAPCLLRRTGVNLLSFNPSQSGQCSPRDPLTGEPDAGKPPSGSEGGAGGQPPVPTPIAST